MKTLLLSQRVLAAHLVALIGWSFLLAGLSRAFAYDRDIHQKPVLLFVAAQMAAGILYLSMLRILRRQSSSRGRVVALLAVGLVMRLSQWSAEPILETDHYRYLFDGGVTAQGFNPYRFKPETVLAGESGVPANLQRLGEQSGVVLERINHPELRTIYPPMAQAIFAVAYWLAPFNINGLRCTWLALDLVVVSLLLVALRSVPSRPIAFSVAVYWLNPLLIKEIFNAGHMELVVLAAAMASLGAALKRHELAALLSLAVAIGAKVWPVLWLPLLLRGAAPSPVRRALGLIVLTIGTLLLAWPLVASGLDPSSGLAAYSRRWQMNDAAHLLLHELFRWLGADSSRLAARAAVMLILAAVILRALGRYRARTFAPWLCGSALAVTASLFLLSPTQFPWYFLWMLPLLALKPVGALLALTVTLPLYYVRFPLAAAGAADWFDYGLVWIEFVPIWVALAIELKHRSRGGESQRVTGRLELNSTKTTAKKPAPHASEGWFASQRKPLWKGEGGLALGPRAKRHRVRSALRPSGREATLRVAVVIPALNEQEAIGLVLAEIPRWVTQVVVVDNGSSDRTADVARNFGATVVEEPRRGYGAACLAGLAAVDRPHIVVFLDGDHSDDPREMDQLVAPLARDEADLVIGSRVLGRAETGALTLQQRYGNALACGLIRLIYGVSWTDLGPFRAIRYTSLQRLRMDDPDYGWTVQMQVRAARLGLRGMEVPVRYRRRIGQSKISGTLRGTIGAGNKILRVLFRESVRDPSGETAVPAERVILFTRHPTPGCAKTRLIPLLGAAGAANLHRQLVHIAAETARNLRRRRPVALELRVTGATPRAMAALFGRDLQYRDQGAGDLGARLQRAVADAVQSSSRKVVLIGSDCPLLDADRIDEALTLLEHHEVVLGPATDGGYYLIGLRAEHPELFVGVTWGSPDVLRQTLAACDRLGLSSVLLPPLSDVDHPEDLQTWAAARSAPPTDRPRLSIIIPVRNEQDHLSAAIASALTAQDVELIVVDGQSIDRTREIARRWGVTLIESEPCRGRQLNAGAQIARSERLLFLHADTLLPGGFARVVEQTLARSGVAAGAFELGIDARGLAPRWIEWGVFLRGRMFGRPYGDQAIFLSRETFECCGGYPEFPVMDDYAMLARLKRLGRILVVPPRVRTSARRWETRGWLRTTLTHQAMIWRFRLTGGE